MKKGDKVSERMRKRDVIAQMLNDGMEPKEIAQKLGAHVSYVFAVRSQVYDVDLNLGMMSEWNKVTSRLKNSSLDLSKIRIVKKRDRGYDP